MSAFPTPIMTLGRHQLLTREAVELYVQEQRPMANVVICYGALSSAADSIVDTPGHHVCSCERHQHSIVAAHGENVGATRNGSVDAQSCG